MCWSPVLLCWWCTPGRGSGSGHTPLTADQLRVSVSADGQYLSLGGLSRLAEDTGACGRLALHKGTFSGWCSLHNAPFSVVRHMGTEFCKKRTLR